MELILSRSVDCLCDFTYDFYWQHKGKRLDPSGVIPDQQGSSLTYSDIVSLLKKGEDVYIKGNAGRRLGSSLGVDLKFFGGNGRSLKVGSIIVEGDVDSRMGISMLSGAIFVKGSVKQPLGNVIEVESDRKGFRKYRSITDILQGGRNDKIILPNIMKGDTLLINDGLIRDTVAARLDSEKKIVIEGNAGMSTGILMKRGSVHVEGDSGKNTGVLLNGGSVIVNDTEEFAGAYMRDGILIIYGKSKGFVGANMKGGRIFYKGEAMIKHTQPDGKDIRMLIRLLGISGIHAMMFKKYYIQ
ncbi:MAG: tributyrin esterase [Candidatus Methanoperedens sp.]|nr:tributyrin esterase [Candidatus Methanoperedens sp.]